jgi:hypothetical protein
MSANISADGKSFYLDVTPKSEQSLKQRVPACNISLVVDENGEFKFEDGVSKLGDLSFSITVTGENYSTDQSDLNIENKIVTKTVESSSTAETINPCLLDADGNGVVTKSDIDSIFDRSSVPRKFDLNGDGIANDADRLLAYEYIGSVCTPAGFPDIEVITTPVLDLDGSNYDGSGTWFDASGNDYHFEVRADGDRFVPPIKNEDGSITVGSTGKILDSDPDDAFRNFRRFNVVDYESDKSFTAENIENQTATTEGVYREKYIPDVDQDYSFEFVFKFTDDLPHGGLGQGSKFKVFGYANHGKGGYNFGSGSSNAQYAYDPDVFIPYHGLLAQTYAGGGVDAEPGSPNAGLPHPSDYPNPLPYSLKVQQLSTGVNNRYRGGSASVPSFNLALDAQQGMSNGAIFCVQYVVSPSTQTVKIYANGIEQPAGIDVPVGIGLPHGNANFVIGTSPQGGWNPPDGLDIFMLRVYDKALSEQQIQKNWNDYSEKYYGL